MGTKWCPREPLDPRNEVPGDPGEALVLGVWPWERRGSILEPPELAQTAKAVILLKLSLILMNIGFLQERVGGRRVTQ